MAQEVWRKVDGMAIRCSGCDMDKTEPVYAEEDVNEERPIGVNHVCVAMDGICVFMHKKPDNDKWYPSFKDVYEDEGDKNES